MSPRAIGDWLQAGRRSIHATHWLPRLAPQYAGGGRPIEIDGDLWRIFASDYLRPEKPTAASCYNRLANYARMHGLALPSCKTFERRIKSETALLAKSEREGREALRRTVPPLRRTIDDLHAMQLVNADGHQFDVFVQWEDGRIGRPIMVGIQDVYSRKLLAHRIGETESALLARAAFADLFRDYGIPHGAFLDNGRGFASKSLTGGAKTRFRFKIKDTDPTGVLTSLGVETLWTLPYRGSSKPIERAWRDLCDHLAKHPAIAGAYTGNRPDAKPENYRERAIPIAEFREHVAREIAEHNARGGRRTDAANGRSFDQAFRDSYAISPIRKATEAQLRIAMLEAGERRCDRNDGSILLAGNRYWSEELHALAGKKVVVRFDPDNLHSEVHVYREDGRYFGCAPVWAAVGFNNKEGAVRRKKRENNVARDVKALRKSLDLLTADRVAEVLRSPSSPTPQPNAGVIRPVRHLGHTAAALKPIDQAETAPPEPEFIDSLVAGIAQLKSVE